MFSYTNLMTQLNGLHEKLNGLHSYKYNAKFSDGIEAMMKLHSLNLDSWNEECH